MHNFTDTAFTPHQERVLYPITVMGIVIFAPLSAYHFAFGDARLGAVIACIVAVLAIDTFALRHGRRPPIPFPLLLVPGAVAVGLSLFTQGLYGVLWAYPMALVTFFALPRRYANATALAFGGMVATLVDLQLGAGLAIRFVLSLAVCLVVLNVIMRVLEEQQARLVQQTLTDPLTGAFNRRQLEMSLAGAIRQDNRGGPPSTLVLVDIDHFESLNDRLGHEAGDRLVVGVAQRIRERCRPSDLLFRLGGEEFVVLLPATESLEAAGLAQELRRAVATARILEERNVTATLAVSQVRRGDTVDTWLRRLDKALFEAKRSGRDCVLTTHTRLQAGPAVVPSAEETPLA